MNPSEAEVDTDEGAGAGAEVGADEEAFWHKSPARLIWSQRLPSPWLSRGYSRGPAYPQGPPTPNFAEELLQPNSNPNTKRAKRANRRWGPPRCCVVEDGCTFHASLKVAR